MKNKFIIAALLAATLTLAACGNSTTNESADAEETVDYFAEGSHDASTKDNEYEQALANSQSVQKGTLDTIDGKYDISGTTYTFADGVATVVMDGTYQITSGKITLAYTGVDEATYDITETDTGFNLLHDSTLLPLTYMSGTDGLTGSELFDGVYSMGDQGYIFDSDGTLTVLDVYDDLTVTDSEITFAAQTYDWRVDGDSIILSTNGTDVMTLIPKD